VSGQRRHPRLAGGLVVPGRIKGEVSKELSVLGEHPHVQAVDEQDHSLARVGVPNTDVVKTGPVSKRHLDTPWARATSR
jgi:hypothetical protein